ncbi:hypothetical protein FQR65_LT07531 [Abscondita terminalis]|nr:hypothetical protein FQR65_LT07531 [Abscondita terminalis]
MKNKKLIPPDGGWGWFIMIAYAIFNFIYMPILQNFGIVFVDTFKEMGLSATDGSLVINTNSAVCLFMGLANGPLLKKYGFRKVSVASAVFICAGLIFTAYMKSFIGLIIAYGFVTSIGIGLGMCSYPLALNSYFVKKRNKVTGLALTITGLGSILMPQMITALIEFYGIEGALLVIAGMSFNTFVSAVLLQPLKWHMIEDPDETKNSDNAIETPKNLSTTDDKLEATKPETFELEQPEQKTSTKGINRVSNFFKRMLSSIIEAFDLTLLKDPQYVILMLGLAFTLFSELNFSLLTPFILSDVGLNTNEIATFLSVLSLADLVLRFVAPFIGDFFNLTARVIFIVSLVILSSTRFTLVIFTSYNALLIISVALGIAKGIRTVYWSLILPEYLPIERLSSALSLEMVVNGVVVLAGGPVLGVIRDLREVTPTAFT